MYLQHILFLSLFFFFSFSSYGSDLTFHSFSFSFLFLASEPLCHTLLASRLLFLPFAPFAYFLASGFPRLFALAYPHLLIRTFLSTPASSHLFPLFSLFSACEFLPFFCPSSPYPQHIFLSDVVHSLYPV